MHLLDSWTEHVYAGEGEWMVFKHKAGVLFVLVWALGLCFVWNVVAYAVIMVKFGDDGRRKMKKKMKRRITMYLFVFIFCWVWDIVDFFVTVVGKADLFWINVLASSMTPLQGFLNFLVYGISSRMFRHPRKKVLYNRRALESAINNHDKSRDEEYQGLLSESM